MVEERFLLDSNSFIAPYNNFYPFDITPGFWNQLLPILVKDNVMILDLVKSEVEKGGDELTNWINSIEDINVLDRRDQIIISKYSEILKFVQESELYNDKALREWSRSNVADPWLIAAASTSGSSLVTFESSAGIINPNNPSGKPKTPDVAKKFGVKCVDMFYFMRKMGIRWK